MKHIQRDIVDEYRNLIYNAHTMLKDYYTYEDLNAIPIKDLFSLIEYFKPKLQEIYRRQQQSALEMELQGKKGQLRPKDYRNRR